MTLYILDDDIKVLYCTRFFDWLSWLYKWLYKHECEARVRVKTQVQSRGLSKKPEWAVKCLYRHPICNLTKVFLFINVELLNFPPKIHILQNQKTGFLIFRKKRLDNKVKRWDNKVKRLNNKVKRWDNKVKGWTIKCYFIVASSVHSATIK